MVVMSSTRRGSCMPIHSVDTFCGRHVVHLIIERLVDDCSVVQLHGRILYVGLVQERQRVFHPCLVVTFWEIFVRVCTARFLASLSGHHLLACLIKQILEL